MSSRTQTAPLRARALTFKRTSSYWPQLYSSFCRPNLTSHLNVLFLCAEVLNQTGSVCPPHRPPPPPPYLPHPSKTHQSHSIDVLRATGMGFSSRGCEWGSVPATCGGGGGGERIDVIGLHAHTATHRRYPDERSEEIGLHTPQLRLKGPFCPPPLFTVAVFLFPHFLPPSIHSLLYRSHSASPSIPFTPTRDQCTGYYGVSNAPPPFPYLPWQQALFCR